MSMKQDANALIIPRARGRGLLNRRFAVAIAGAVGLCWVMCVGYRMGRFQTRSAPVLETVEVDQGDVALVVTENGSLESSVDDVVRCRVESFHTLPVGAPVAIWEPRPSQARMVRTRGTAAGPKDPTIAAATRAKVVAKAGLMASQGAPRSGATGAGAALKLGASTSKSGSSVTVSSLIGEALDSASAPRRPVIRSFDQIVEPHIPLRSTFPDQGVIPSIAPPPPTILSILPEGSRVKAGDVVCVLDSSALLDALAVQTIRHVQAKAWVEQAKYILAADEIALREYEAGILPQDIELVRQNIGICAIERARAERNLAWSRTALAKGFRSESQVDADSSMLQQSEIALRDAEGMLTRLVKYTGKRILKAHRAKIEAIHSDLLSLECSFRLETERLKRVERMIANCTMRAPRNGIVVYADGANGSGTAETQIREGLIVRQSQPIFRLLDPRHLQVRAKINESQVARIRSGQPVLIHLEAFPDRLMRGSVAAIVPIPSLANGPFPDVRTFYATVRIESGGFDALTTGLSAELEILIETRSHVTRIPLEAIRWVADRPFAATAINTASEQNWEWKPIALGLTNTTFAEVVSGLEPGDRVIAHCESLPATGLGAPDSRTGH